MRLIQGVGVGGEWEVSILLSMDWSCNEIRMYLSYGKK
jgi:hypothetical protein